MKNIRTYLYCYDDHRGFSEDIRKKFSDASRYTVLTFQTREGFLDSFRKDSESKFARIAILGVHDNKEHYETIDHLTIELKKIDPMAGIILICPPEKTGEISNTVKFNIDAYVPQNSNTILRIHNIVKKLISEHTINIHRKRRNVSLAVLFAFVILSFILALVAYIRFPDFF
jgi:hypothetical protein